MPIRHLLSTVPDTIRSFEAAAEQRYWEAVELLVSGQINGGIYLLGYSVEMWLKSSVFRFDGAFSGQAIKPLLAPTRQWQKLYLPTIELENYHSLWFWALLLRVKRNHAGRPFAADFDHEFVRHARRLHQGWFAELRYRADAVLEADVQSMHDSAAWLRLKYLNLWS